ncbi:MAG: hypothetical protein U0414_08715 [Polyangiaceae bacterium]
MGSKKAPPKSLNVEHQEQEVDYVGPASPRGRGEARQWRQRGKPRSLSIQIVPTILDVFTSEKGSDVPKKVFFLGESVQWNVIHRVSPFVKVPKTVTVHLHKIGLGAFSDEPSHTDVVFPVETVLFSTSKYKFETTWNSWSIPALGPFNPIVGPASRTALVEGVKDGKFNLLSHPGFWKMTAIVQIESNIDHPFDLVNEWHYLFLPRRREDG